jgi:hypothetical protein
VILRIILGQVRPGELRNLVAAHGATYLPQVRRQAGLVRAHLAVRPDGDRHEVVGVTFWTNPESAQQALGSDLSDPVLLGDLAAFVDLRPATYFEVDETVLRRSERDPVALRLTIGRFSRPGSDRLMQDLLRERAPLIDDDMTEAYVGRRVDGRHVEVTFVSAWQRIPEEMPLDQPFWPDISTRYDEFFLAVYVPLVLAASAAS